MIQILYLAPLAITIALLATGRASLVKAGLVGLGLTAAVSAVAIGTTASIPAFLLRESLRGAWIAWHAIAIILAGLVFIEVLRAAQPELFATDRPAAAKPTHGRLFALCFLVGPFAEAATGFGIGIIVVVAALARLGIRGVPAVLLALFSQILVPWGALAVGTTVGAGLAQISVVELGTRSALLSAPLLAGYLVLFWIFAARVSVPASAMQKAEDAVWVAALAGAVWAVNRYVAVDIAVLLACGGLLALRLGRDAAAGEAVSLRASLSGAAPYLILTGGLVVTRLVPPLRDALVDLAVVRPFADLPAFPLLYHPSLWLLVTAVAYSIFAGVTVSWAGILSKSWRAGRLAVAVSLIFMVMAQLMAGSGMAAALAESWIALTGGAAVLASPFFGAVGGFLTGSIVAANGLTLPIQTALAESGGYDSAWLAALQNTAAGNASMLSPMRVALGAALIGAAGGEGLIYRKALPLGLMPVAVLIAAAAMLF